MPSKIVRLGSLVHPKFIRGRGSPLDCFTRARPGHNPAEEIQDAAGIHLCLCGSNRAVLPEVHRRYTGDIPEIYRRHTGTSPSSRQRKSVSPRQDHERHTAFAPDRLREQRGYRSGPDGGGRQERLIPPGTCAIPQPVEDWVTQFGRQLAQYRLWCN